MATSLPILFVDENAAYSVNVSYNKHQWHLEKKEQLFSTIDEKQNTYFNMHFTKKQRPVLLLSPSQYQEEKTHIEWMHQYKNTPAGYWLPPTEHQSFAYYVSTQTLEEIAHQFKLRRHVFYAIDCYDYAILNLIQEFKLSQGNMLILCEWKKNIRCLCSIQGVLTKVINTSVYGIVQGNTTPEAILVEKLMYYYPEYLDTPLNIFTIGYVPLLREALPSVWKIQSLYTQDFFHHNLNDFENNTQEIPEPIMLPLLGAGMFYAKHVI